MSSSPKSDEYLHEITKTLNSGRAIVTVHEAWFRALHEQHLRELASSKGNSLHPEWRQRKPSPMTIFIPASEYWQMRAFAFLERPRPLGLKHHRNRTLLTRRWF